MIHAVTNAVDHIIVGKSLILTVNHLNLPDTANSENGQAKKQQRYTYSHHQDQNRIYEGKKRNHNICNILGYAEYLLAVSLRCSASR
jgi:hypothetical protein